MLLVRTRLGLSPIHGVGLYAAEFIREATMIWRFGPVIDLRLTDEQIEQLPAPCRAQARKYSYRDKLTGLYILCGDDARFFNHSDAPNCIDLQDAAEQDITLAARDIGSGEELTCNYALFDLDWVEGKYKI